MSSVSHSNEARRAGIPDVGVHDILIGEAAMFFRVGSLCLSMASSKPTDSISQYGWRVPCWLVDPQGNVAS
jgi:hypothetical protein